MLGLALSLLVTTPADLAWLSGYWLSCDGGREVSETWSSQYRDVLLGMSLSLNGAL